MLEAPALDHELERLADLYSLDIMDTVKEERFDRLTRLAGKLLNVEMCYLALLDGDRQWFKSKCGISNDSTDRNVSFCGHTIANDGLMVVNDAQKDSRFFDNPLVIGEPYLRFYAGYPLRGPDGHNVGTFCIADPTPRELSQSQADLLIDFALMAERELNMMDLIQSQNQLLETQAELNRVRASLQRELHEAAEYVQSQLPEEFDTPQLKLNWRFIASSQLGGDMFGLRPIDAQRHLVYVLDVAGHGVGASLLAVSVQNLIKQLDLDGGKPVDPAAILSKLNLAFPMENYQDRFFTIWVGVIDFGNHTITYSSGGHPPPFLVSPGGQIKSMGIDSWMIGIEPTAEFENCVVPFSPRDRVLLYSDGIIEQICGDGSTIGRERLKEVLVSHYSGPEVTLESLFEIFEQCKGDHPFSDDVSMIELTLSDSQ